MVLPFVRELFADVENLSTFRRAASHLRDSAGRISLSGITPTAKVLLLVLLQRSADRPLIVVVSDNRAAEDLVPVLQSFADLSGASDANSIVALPARDVLPFQNLSPHPEIQEERATALWKIATGAVALVVAPVAATTIRLASTEYYTDLARAIRRGETFDTEALLQHLNTVGYDATDVVEMPGQYALRGGILDVYSPEADRPGRIEVFSDDGESIRKFDPASQRSSSPVDDALLLPLTETPVREDLLGAIHVRLSGKCLAGNEQVIERAIRSGGVTVFPGWEFYAPVARESRSLFELLPNAVVLTDERDNLHQELDRTWTRIEEAHERSGVGNLVKPSDLYFPPDEWWRTLATLPGAELEHLEITRSEDAERTMQFPSQPTPRFHGSVPAMLEEVGKLVAE